MLHRTLTVLAFVALLAAPLARADDQDWEETYGNGWQDEPAPSDDYRVSVDMDTGGDSGVSFETFQGALTPYGEWVVVGGLGRVWRPHVAAGWRPYYYGRWEWTNEGWLWVSEEPFGWAAYHYGRWNFDPYYGWVWLPGYQWAPAWVSWRYSGDVVGWAPLGPGVSVYVSSYPFVATSWTFVPCHSFVGGPVYRVAYAPTYARRYYDATAAAPPRVPPGRRPAPGVPARPSFGPGSPAWGGPPPRVIESRLGRPLAPVRVVTAPTPGPARVGNGEVSIFRPPPRVGGSRPAPGPGAMPRPDRPAFGADGNHPPAPGMAPGMAPRPGSAFPAPGRDEPAQRPFGTVGRDAPGPRPADRPSERPAPPWGGGRPERGAPAPAPAPAFGGGHPQAPAPGGAPPPPRGSYPAPGAAPSRAAPMPSPAPAAPRMAPAPGHGGGGHVAPPGRGGGRGERGR